MVSSSNQQQQQANTLLVSSPVILSSASHLTPTSNVISSIAQHNQPILQVFQNQQRPILYSQPQMILQGQNQLLAAHKMNSTNFKPTMFNHLTPNNPAQQTLLINPAQQQFLVNKSLIDSQKGKHIIFSQPTNTANPQSRSQLLPNLHHSIMGQNQFRHPQFLTSQSPLLSPAQFLGQPGITWISNQTPLNSQFVFHQTPTFHQNLTNQTKEVQLVQTPNPTNANGRSPDVSIPIPIVTNSTSSSDSNDNVSSNDALNEDDEQKKSSSLKITSTIKKAIKKVQNQRDTVIRNRKTISDKMIKNQTKKIRVHSLKPGHKSTQQMNDELLANERNLNLQQKSEIVKDLKTKKKKKVSIVKPRVVLKHSINGFLIYESCDKPFPVTNGSSIDEDDLTSEKEENGKLNTNDSTSLELDEINEDQSNKGLLIKDTKIREGKKLKKSKKKMKSKSTNDISNSINSNLQSSSSNGSKLVDKNLSEFNSKNRELSIDCELSEEEESSSSVSHLSLKSDTIQKTSIHNGDIDSNKSIYQFTVEDVYEFVMKITSNNEFATALKNEQFDGYALSLLTIPILRNFELKLGPILLLKKKIDELKEKSNSNESNLEHCLPPSGTSIFKWSVQDTYHFVENLTTKEIADEFLKQEIDGYSLTLLTDSNIRNDLNICYGQALKIITKITELKAK